MHSKNAAMSASVPEFPVAVEVAAAGMPGTGSIAANAQFHGLCPIDGDLASDSSPTVTTWPATTGVSSVTWSCLPQDRR